MYFCGKYTSNWSRTLIDKGKSFTFANNSYRSQYGVYSKPSDEFLAWIATVEDFIIQNFGENSSAFRLYKKFDDSFVSGYEKDEFDGHHTKLIAALKACYTTTPTKTSKPLTQTDLLKSIFDKFHSVVIQLRKRYHSRDTLDVQDEYDVQDLLHCLLKIHYNDIRKEEWTPSYAGGSSRMDFLLKEEQLVIEVKMTRQGLSDKELGKQLIEDYFQYLKDLKDVCQKLEIPFNESDRILFEADKRVNKDVKLDNY